MGIGCMLIEGSQRWNFGCKLKEDKQESASLLNARLIAYKKIHPSHSSSLFWCFKDYISQRSEQSPLQTLFITYVFAQGVASCILWELNIFGFSNCHLQTGIESSLIKAPLILATALPPKFECNSVLLHSTQNIGTQSFISRSLVSMVRLSLIVAIKKSRLLIESIKTDSRPSNY